MQDKNRGAVFTGTPHELKMAQKYGMKLAQPFS